MKEILVEAHGGPEQLNIHIDYRYPLADTARAHADLEARKTTGKLLLLTP